MTEVRRRVKTPTAPTPHSVSSRDPRQGQVGGHSAARPQPSTTSPTRNALFWAAREAPVRTGNERLVLVALADRWNPIEHCARPSHATIAEQTRLSVSAVKVALKGLRAAGTVDWREMRLRRHRGRDGSPNCYMLPSFDPAPPAPPQHFIVKAAARTGRGGTSGGVQAPESGAAPTSVGRRLELRRAMAEAGSRHGQEVPLQVPDEVHDEGRTTSDGCRRPTGATPAVNESLAEDSAEAAVPARRVIRTVGCRDGVLPPAAQRGDSPHGCAQRLKILLLAHENHYADPVNVRQLTATLRRWVDADLPVELVREMVDTFADAPDRYLNGDEVPWRAFINARQKLAADAEKRLEAAHLNPPRRPRSSADGGRPGGAPGLRAMLAAKTESDARAGRA